MKAATVALLFVLIPHQAPSAEPVEPSAQTDVTAPAASAAQVEAEAVKSEPLASEDVGMSAPVELAESSQVATPATEGAKRFAESQIDPDGYSWSVRSLR